MSYSRLKHPKSENNKFKPVSEIISFRTSFKFEKLSYFEEKGGASGFHYFSSHNFFNLQLILDCNIPKFKLKHQQFKNSETKLVIELVFLLLSNKGVAFLGTPGSTHFE